MSSFRVRPLNRFFVLGCDSDMSHDDGDDLPATARKDLSATQQVDTFHDSDDDEGRDSEDMDSAAEGLAVVGRGLGHLATHG